MSVAGGEQIKEAESRISMTEAIQSAMSGSGSGHSYEDDRVEVGLIATWQDEDGIYHARARVVHFKNEELEKEKEDFLFHYVHQHEGCTVDALKEAQETEQIMKDITGASVLEEYARGETETQTDDRETPDLKGAEDAAPLEKDFEEAEYPGIAAMDDMKEKVTEVRKRHFEQEKDSTIESPHPEEAEDGKAS